MENQWWHFRANWLDWFDSDEYIVPRVIVFLLGFLVLLTLAKKGHTYSLAPILFILWLLNPAYQPIKIDYSAEWQPWCLGMLVFGIYLPRVREILVKLCHE